VFQKIDCIRIHVPNLESALKFYRDKLGLGLVWRKGQAQAGLRMKAADTELVLVTENLNGTEVDILVDSADESARDFERLGGKIVSAPFDIPIGRCSVIQDPWGNRFVILDMNKGPLKTDMNKNVE
jgi:predicted enzyme related to lactoylglutathione lyase